MESEYFMTHVRRLSLNCSLSSTSTDPLSKHCPLTDILHTMSTRISKRVSFRDRPDWIMGRYFFFTLPYALFFIIGSIIGYSRTGNLFCLLGGGGVGVLFLLLSAGHMIDYYRQVRIDSFYVGIPFSKLHQPEFAQDTARI